MLPALTAPGLQALRVTDLACLREDLLGEAFELLAPLRRLPRGAVEMHGRVAVTEVREVLEILEDLLGRACEQRPPVREREARILFRTVVEPHLAEAAQTEAAEVAADALGLAHELLPQG